MFAEAANVFAPGDAQGVAGTSKKDLPPHRSYQLDAPNVLLGALGLLVVLWLSHRHLGKRR